MLIGPHEDPETRALFAERIQRDPASFVAQPMLEISTVPTFNGEALEPRHVDLRPFIVQAARSHVTTGGLSRVSRAPGSVIVNSSQGAEAAIQRQHRYPFLRAVIEHTQAIDGIINGTLARGPTYQFLMLGRFLERADMTTRLIEVRTATLPRDTLDASPLRDDAVWVNVLRYLGAYSQYRQQRGLAIQGGKVVDFLLRDERFPRSVRFCLDALDAALRDLPAPAEPLEAVEAAGRRAQGPLAAGAATAAGWC